MPDLGTLRPGQQAILRSLGEPGSSYADVAAQLDTTPQAVRRVAREALEDIAGRPSQVEAGWRQRLTDYVLGQCSAEERAEILRRLERSAAARGWAARAVEGLPPALRRESLPPIRAHAPVRRRDRMPGVRRRELLVGALAAFGAAMAAGVALLRSGEPERAGRTASGGGGPGLRVERQMRLRPAGSAVGAGIAVVAARGVRREVLVQARLASGGGRYELRLSGGGGESRSLGVLRADARGNLRAALPLPADYRSFATLDLTGVDGPAVLSAQLGAA